MAAGLLAGRASTSSGVAPSRCRSRAGSGRRSGSRRRGRRRRGATGGPPVLEPQALARVGDGREQEPRVRVQRVLEHLFGRAALDDLARVHDEHLVGDVARAREIVRDVEEGEVALLLQLRASGSGSRSGSRRRASRSARRRGSRAARRRARGRSRRAGAGRPTARADTSARSPSRARGRRVSSSSCTRSSTPLARHDPVDPQRPLEVVRDRLDRVQRAERVLEDHLHLRAVAEDRLPAGRCASRRGLRTRPCRRSARRAARGSARRCSCRCRSRRRAP